MTETPMLELRQMSVEDEREVLDLLTSAMSGGPTGSRTSEFFRWKHRNSPFGASPGLVAVHAERIVGVRLFLRWQLVSSAGTVHALRAVDTATHPDFLRQGIFKNLTLTLLSDLERTEQVDLVFNTPNADSRPGYLRMGWQEVGLLPVHIAPVRPVRFVRGMRGASSANASGGAASVSVPCASPTPAPLSSLAGAAAAFDDVGALQQLVADSRDTGEVPQLRTPLSVDYLRWRYVEPPGLDYRCVPVQRHGRLVGLGFGRLRRRAGLAEFTLGDVITRPDDRRAVAAVLRAARGSGADHVAVHAAPGSLLARAKTRAGYLRVPGNGIRLVANPRSERAHDVLATSAWRLSLGDLEVF